MAENVLRYGDSLQVLRDEIPDESVDLIYLDPPFKSDRNYNVFPGSGGQESPARMQAFEDIEHAAKRRTDKRGRPVK